MKNEPESQVLIYQTSDGATRLEVFMEKETIWRSGGLTCGALKPMRGASGHSLLAA